MAVEFDKYQKNGAIHWKQTHKTSINFNAPLVSRYNSVIKHLPSQAASALDIGCGDGRLTCLIAEALPHAKVVGIDADRTGIEIASRQRSALGIKNVSFSVNEKEELPFGNASFDVVVMTDVIEHLIRPKFMLQEICRLLGKDGVAVITTPNRQDGTKWDTRHEYEFNTEELKELMGDYFGHVDVYGSWPMSNVRAWRAKGLGRLNLDLQARLGRNLFDSEVRDPSPEWGQLTAVASLPIS